MRCVNCGHNSKARERGPGPSCPKCHRRFALDPARDPMTDYAFANAISAVSDNKRVAWTSGHLFYEVARWIRRRRWLARLARRPYVVLDEDYFEDMLRRWHEAHGIPPSQVPKQAFAEPPADEGLAPDVADYAFERVVVCADEEFVDFLLANSFHAENRVPVFAANGYPEQVLTRLTEVLEARPPREIVVVHDADPEGCALAARVSEDRRWGGRAESIRVIDAGFRPGDAKQFRGAFQPAGLGARAEDVTEEERKWLAKYRLELEAAQPRSMLVGLGKLVQTPLEELAAQSVSGGRLLTLDNAWIGLDLGRGLWNDYSG